MRKHITVSVDEHIYRQAREWAARRDTSVSAVVQYLLEHLPGLPAARRFHTANSESALAAKPAPPRKSAQQPAPQPESQPAAPHPSVPPAETEKAENEAGKKGSSDCQTVQQ